MKPEDLPTDRELLEAAAKAAGITLRSFDMTNAGGELQHIGYMADPSEWPRGWFNPLTDDGDALRLAVKLRLHIGIETDAACAWQLQMPSCWASEATDADPNAATRRAIVSAAARLTQIRERRAAASLGSAGAPIPNATGGGVDE